jgi:hypothetical protein
VSARLRLGFAVAVSLTLAGARARADDQEEAVKLFDKGRALMQSAATLGEACRTLEASLKLWDRGDTVLNLALCHRRQGRTATAWTEFNKALNHGTKVGFPEAIEEAKRQRAELAAILSKLTITVPPATAKIEGLTVEVQSARPDEPPQAWPREAWNIATVIDPGPVRVRAEAKGYKPFEAQVDIGASKDVKTVLVTLQPEPPPLPPEPPPKPPVRPVVAQARPVWPWIVGGAGLALGAGAIAAELLSVSAGNELNKQCGTARNDCPHGYDYTPARTRELVGYGLFVGLGSAGILALGAAGLGLGLSARPQKPSVSLVVSPRSIFVLTAFR